MEEAGVLALAEIFAGVKVSLALLALSALLASLGMWSQAATDGGDDEECCFCCERSLMGVPGFPEFLLFRPFNSCARGDGDTGDFVGSGDCEGVGDGSV
jgi:hypothetical protein